MKPKKQAIICIIKHMKNIKTQLDIFRKTLEKNVNKERAVNEKRYLKSPYKFFGVSVPFTDKMAKVFIKENKNAEREYIFELVKRLWDSEFHEEKRLAVDILRHYPDFIDLEAMPVIEKMLKQSTGWDHIDEISIHLAGAILEKDKKAYDYLKKWSRSDNFWMRRASLISQILLFRHGKGDHKLFFGFAERMLGEKEFFIRKAIGWCIREISKPDPEKAFEFLKKIKGRASALTLREGAKRLPEKMRKIIL
jgi:3-methyladenine DNA glycosylase AlkD